MTPRSSLPGRRTGESGYALLLALFVAAMASVALLLAVTALRIEWDETRSQARRIRLDAMVDAALAETLADRHLLRVPRRPFEDGWIETEVERLPGSRARIRARAGLGGRVRGARIEVRITATGPRVLSWEPDAVARSEPHPRAGGPALRETGRSSLERFLSATR